MAWLYVRDALLIKAWLWAREEHYPMRSEYKIKGEYCLMKLGNRAEMNATR